MLAPKEYELNTSEANLKGEKEESLNKIYLSGTQEWSLESQNAAKALLKEYSCVFSRNNLDLSRSSIVKHKIKDEIPFKDRYR